MKGSNTRNSEIVWKSQRWWTSGIFLSYKLLNTGGWKWDERGQKLTLQNHTHTIYCSFIRNWGRIYTIFLFHSLFFKFGIWTKTYFWIELKKKFKEIAWKVETGREWWLVDRAEKIGENLFKRVNVIMKWSENRFWGDKYSHRERLLWWTFNMHQWRHDVVIEEGVYLLGKYLLELH